MIENAQEIKISIRLKGPKTTLSIWERGGDEKFAAFDRPVTKADSDAFKRAAKAAKLLAAGVTDLAEIRRLASGQKVRRNKAIKKPAVKSQPAT